MGLRSWSRAMRNGRSRDCYRCGCSLPLERVPLAAAEHAGLHFLHRMLCGGGVADLMVDPVLVPILAGRPTGEPVERTVADLRHATPEPCLIGATTAAPVYSTTFAMTAGARDRHANCVARPCTGARHSSWPRPMLISPLEERRGCGRNVEQSGQARPPRKRCRW